MGECGDEHTGDHVRPDPAAVIDDDGFPYTSRHRLPAFGFDAEEYLEVVSAAMSDRSWETV